MVGRRHGGLTLGGAVLALFLLVTPGSAAAPPDPPGGEGGPTLTLDEAVREALARNPQVIAAQQALEASRQQVLQAQAGLSPQVSAQATATVGNTLSGSVPSPTVTPTGSLGLLATVPLYDGGRTRVAVAQAQALAAQAEAALQQARQDVALQAATAFLTVLKDERLATVRAAQLAQARALLAQAEARVRSGVAARSDVVQAQAQVAQAEVDLMTAQAQVGIAKGALASMVGRPLGAPLEVAEPPVPREVLPPTPDPLLASADTRRPEVAAAAAAVQASVAALEQAVLTAGVQVNVALDASAVPLSTQTDPRTILGGALTGTVTFPVFDGGRTSSAVNAARAGLNAAQAKLDQTRLAVRQDAYQAFLALQQAEAALRATDAARTAAEEALRVAEGRYRAGVASIVEVLTARVQAVQAEVNATSAVYDYEAALVTLRHAAGMPILASPQGGSP